MNHHGIGQSIVLLTALVITACGGGAGTASNPEPQPSASCDPTNAATFDQCGTVYLALTDAEGDFLNYTVDVMRLTLETANGRTVEVLPARTRVDFADYVNLSEIVAAAYVPPATYVSGMISIDYTDSEIHVEAGDVAKEVVVTDTEGHPLTTTDLRIVLSNRDQLTVTRRRAHFLQLDFDLEASHDVDTAPTPATAATSQFIVAEAHPVDAKEIRVRGPLVEVDESDMNYTIRIRPGHHRFGDFGRFTVGVTDQTEFEVDGAMYVGMDGLRALSAAGPGTPTIAGGSLTVLDRSFTADVVLAGSSVPGHDRDAVVGNIIKREGNFLTVRGATIVPRLSATDRRVHFHDDVTVEIGPDTKVFKEGYRQSDLTTDALSVGQRITVLGNQPVPTTDALAPQILFDATEGAVRMHVTRLAGTVNTVTPGQTDITLYSIDRRHVDAFNFSGTGPSPELDADPANYEVRTLNLTLADFAAGKPIVVFGFPTAFSLAPPDFSGRSVIDYTDVRDALGIGWGPGGTVVPFVAVGPEGMILDNQNPDIGLRHHIKHGPVLIDFTALDSNTTIVPRETDRLLFSIRSSDSLRLYSDWADFTNDLNMSLGAGNAARSLHAYGKFDMDSNTFHAYKLGVYLLEP